MKTSADNPEGNGLPEGLDEIKLAEAVLKSGYPLQISVANQLRKSYFVQHEWSFNDDETNTLRALDIFAEKRLYMYQENNHPRIRPTLNLLIECKQADLPYVFFLSPDKPYTRNFPIIAGLPKNSIEIKTDDDPSTWHLSLTQALNLDTHDFIKQSVGCCMSLSKVERKGKDLKVQDYTEIELSGKDPFKNIVLPLVKAVKHFCKDEQPPVTAHYFDLHITMAVAILDAPMVTVQETQEGQQIISTPWVRVFRHEYSENEDWSDRSQMYAIDFVHKDYLEKFLTDHVEPFSKHLGDLALKHAEEIISGKGFAKDMEKHWVSGVEERLQPRNVAKRVGRISTIIIHLAKNLLGLWKRKNVS